jgi:hypothetical protein
VNVTEHEAAAPPAGTSVHAPASNDPPPEVHATSPAGALALPAPMSRTVTEQCADSPIRTDASQATVVEVARAPTVTAADPSLPTWFESPP